jgi:hypothetical protein
VDDAVRLLFGLLERMPDRGLGRAGRFELCDQAIDPDDVDIDGSAIVAASRNREGDVPDLGRDASGVTQTCPGLAEPGRLANPFGLVARLAIDHGSEYGGKSEGVCRIDDSWFEARLCKGNPAPHLPVHRGCPGRWAGLATIFDALGGFRRVSHSPGGCLDRRDDAPFPLSSTGGDPERRETTEVVTEPRDAGSHPDIGGKVNAIIEAAEAAAEQIGQNARREARETMEQAELAAAARIEELTREAAQTRTEADQYARDMREAADSYGTQHRRGAEEEARRVLADAEKEAKELRDAAQQKAEQIERDVGQRHETLKREARMLEARRQRVLESLRDLAAQLQDALVEPVGKAPQDEALMDALKVERR